MSSANVFSSEGARPALPPGRVVWLPGRGATFVRELGGPPGAPVVVLLHGWTATADLNWFACFTPLARHFRVIALDHRGHGRGLRGVDSFRLEDCADDVAALASVLGVSSLTAVGYSMGGPIAQLLWQRHRGLVEGLVLCATGCTFSGRARERMLFGMVAGVASLAAAVPLGPITMTALAAVSGWNSLRRRQWWGLEEVARHDWAQIVEAGRQIGRFDSRSWIGDVTVPTAVIVTDDDDVVPTRRQQALADTISQASVLHVSAGHAACTEAPSDFADQLVGACLRVTGRWLANDDEMLAAA